MSGADFFAQWDGPFVGLCFGVTAVSILAMVLLSHVLSGELRGEFVQVSYRSSVALLGVAFFRTKDPQRAVLYLTGDYTGLDAAKVCHTAGRRMLWWAAASSNTSRRRKGSPPASNMN